MIINTQQIINKINLMNSSQKIVENRSASEKKLRSTSSSFNPSFVVTNRTKNFKNNFIATYNEAKRSSNVYELANNLYSKKGGAQQFAISNKKVKSTKNINLNPLGNPESKQQVGKGENLSQSKLVESSSQRMTQSLVNLPHRAASPASNLLFQNLSKRTTMLVEYRKQIATLQQQKQDTLAKIHALKRKIINEKKLKSKLVIKSQKHMNSTEHGFDYKAKVKRQTSKNKDQQQDNEDQCKQMVNYLTQADKQNTQLNNGIKEEKEHIKQLQSDISALKHSVFNENNELVTLKSNLTIGLKAMKNSSDMIKYLESQKADLLLFVNKQIEDNTANQQTIG